MQKNGKKPIIDGIKRVRKSGSRIQRDYKPFGRFIINRKELFDNNVMLLKYEKSHGPIKDWHRHKVSDPIIIKGSITAGNNNPKLKAQLRELIELLSNPVIKKINKEDANFLNECLVEMEMND